MNREKGIAYCGLACCACDKNDTCAGCRNEGCTDKEWCKHFNCCKEKGLYGCWECEEFPCGGMHDKIRVLAFAQFIKKNGEEKMMECLERNENAGVVYHYQGQLVGDYDKCVTVDEVMMMLEGDQINIKPVTADALSEYAEVIRQSFTTVAQDFGWTRENCPGHTSFITNERLESKIKDGYYPFGYFTDGKLIGFASLTDMGSGAYEMNDVSILPGYRHWGYGKVLLDFCKDKVKELGGNKITIGIVEENTVLKDWYATNEFIHKGTKQFEHLPFTVGYMEWCV